MMDRLMDKETKKYSTKGTSRRKAIKVLSLTLFSIGPLAPFQNSDTKYLHGLVSVSRSSAAL